MDEDEIDVMWMLFIDRPVPRSEQRFLCWIDGIDGEECYSLRDSFQLGRDTPVSKIRFTADESNEEAVVAFSGKDYEMHELTFVGELLRVEQHKHVLPTATEWSKIFQFLDDLDASME